MTSLTASAMHSNARARTTWEAKAVGCQRSTAPAGSRQYFEDLRNYRYGYETPFIPRVFEFDRMAGKSVLEIGVGNGIDAVEMARHGARYTGLDITENHLSLTRANFSLNLPDVSPTLIRGDLLQSELNQTFDVIYSFGVMHHIHHEEDYLRRMRTLLAPTGSLRIAVYSKWSFFNAYMCLDWLIRRRNVSLDAWRSHFAEASPLDRPVTIKIRSRREVERVLGRGGFKVDRYAKCGFVQKYLPGVGSHLSPDGTTLRAFARVLGWYHVFHCSPT